MGGRRETKITASPTAQAQLEIVAFYSTLFYSILLYSIPYEIDIPKLGFFFTSEMMKWFRMNHPPGACLHQLQKIKQNQKL